MHPPLSRSEAIIDADRCYFCYDAPCTTACPTGIDIPGFIQKIRSGNLQGSAKTILEENIMGGMCARVCPTEVLCEQACVRNTHEDQPVRIGLLQRYATDPVVVPGTKNRNSPPAPLFVRAAPTGRKVAVVGGGPAGLSCAHRLAWLGHDVTLFEPRDKLGGLNEYGIAAYKTIDDFAAHEVEFILGIGGIDVRTGKALGTDFSLAELRTKYDAVFLGFGLAGVNDLHLDGEKLEGVENAVDYIAALRQQDKTSLPVGRRVVVIGGGMTAIDIAVQSKALGAEQVTMVYRRGQEQMNASRYEQEFAQTRGVTLRHWAAPRKLLAEGAHVRGVEFETTRAGSDGKLEATGQRFTLDADVVFKAIGQKVLWDRLGSLKGDTAEIVDMAQDRIAVDDERKTSLSGVWAGGDCVAGGEDLTVSAVQDGKVAAISIDRFLKRGT
jgi:dihydropyrimidine dehydrogenase (NAD+) subunit PreT